MFTIIGGDGREYGPASVSQIKGWMADGRANLDTKAKAVGSEEWRTLADFPEFNPAARMPPPLAQVEPLAVPVARGTGELADRGTRFLAWLLDNVIGFAVCLPGAFLLGFSFLVDLLQQKVDASYELSARATLGVMLLAIGGLTLLAIQVWMLSRRGQTIGKRILGIRIVMVADGRNPGFTRAVGLRWFVPSLIQFGLNAVPPLGLLFFIVDCGFIFRADQRTIHDLIAGTKVVKA